MRGPAELSLEVLRWCPAEVAGRVSAADGVLLLLLPARLTTEAPSRLTPAGAAVLAAGPAVFGRVDGPARMPVSRTLCSTRQKLMLD